MSILITGGHGLLGSSLNFGLKPSRKELDVLNYDDVNSFVIKNNVESIVHAAAVVGGVQANIDQVFDYFSQNMKMNMNILDISRKHSLKKSIYIISTCAFPKSASLPLQEEYLHEGEPHETNYGYAYAKRMLEVGSRSLKQQYGLSSCCLIPCNLYGKNDNYHIQNGHVIPSLIHKCYLAKLNNSNFEIWGSGKAEREFMYVKDFADIIFKIHNEDSKIDGSMIVSSDSIFSIENIVSVIIKKMKFTGNVLFDKSKPEGIMKKNSDNSKFKQRFPNFQFTSLEDGLEETVEHFVKNYSNIRK